LPDIFVGQSIENAQSNFDYRDTADPTPDITYEVEDSYKSHESINQVSQKST
ncbi:25925_t:CDS:1, partial [Racocetra persica]